MGLLTDCQEIFKTQDLYEVLNCSKHASGKEVKMAYYKASLKVHPDKVDAKVKEKATVKFQIIGRVYSILSDKEKKQIYDESGEVDDENLTEVKDWDQYWRLHFSKISVADIENFEKQYKGSDEELEDLKEAYMEGEGSMEFILTNVLCASMDDEERFENIIQNWIDEKKVKQLPKFSQETKKQKQGRRKKAEKEAAEAEKLKAEIGLGNSDQSLAQLIQSRHKDREALMDSFLDDLAVKYGSASKKTKAKK